MDQLVVRLDYPLEQVKEPILYHLVKDYRLQPNIERAKVDVHSGGVLQLALQGEHEDMEAGIAFLRGLGIVVTRL